MGYTGGVCRQYLNSAARRSALMMSASCRDSAIVVLACGHLPACEQQRRCGYSVTACAAGAEYHFRGTVTYPSSLISDDTDSFRFIHLLLRDHFAYRYALKLLPSGRGRGRRAATMMLGGLGDERSIEPLITALTDDYSTVRWHAGNALKKISHPRAIEPLIKALSDNAHAVPFEYGGYDQTPLLYEIAAEALVNIGEPAVDPLIVALYDDNIDIRGRAADVLGRLKNPRAVQPLCELLAISKVLQKTVIQWDKQSVPEIIVQALTSIGTPEALEAVRQWMAKRSQQQGQ